ncbi:MAG: O-methyltransferase [Candidatus Cyclobacteriaceae bacterium M3_2C_046]
MDFIDTDLLLYAEAHTSPESELLHELNRETNLKVIRPRMLSGHLQGKILSLFSKLIAPRYILEIGTYTGYSAISLAEGLQPGGRLITIDYNEEIAEIASRYIQKAGLQDKIQFIQADALKVIPDMQIEFDLVYIDADKLNYQDYYNMIIDKVRSGGLIIADNVLWSGKVLEDWETTDKATRAILAFNKTVQQDQRVENVLFPVRDGLMVIRKK